MSVVWRPGRITLSPRLTARFRKNFRHWEVRPSG